MKRLMHIILSTAILLSVFSFNTEAKEFKGIITYKITFDIPDMDPSMASMLPKIMTYYTNSLKAKTEMKSSMMSQINIIDGVDQITYSLFDMMGQKFYTKMTKEEIDEVLEMETEPTLKFVDETKEIAGYECKKVIVTMEMEGKNQTFNVYYSPELGSKSLNFSNNMFRGIDGALMEFEMNTGSEMSMKLSAISVEKKKIKDTEFEIPEGYEEKTKDELRQSMGGM